MSRSALFTAAVALSALACGSPLPEAIDSPEEAETAVLGFFGAIEAMDLDAVRAAVTPDFEIIEDTLVFDTEGFIGLLEPFVDAGPRISYEFSEFRTEVSGSTAWTRYRNHALMLMNEETTRFEWVESAVLQKVDGAWLVDRLHSVPVDLASGGD